MPCKLYFPVWLLHIIFPSPRCKCSCLRIIQEKVTLDVFGDKIAGIESRLVLSYLLICSIAMYDLSLSFFSIILIFNNP